MNWADLGGFGGDGGGRPRRPTGPGNRRHVVVITCPTCGGIHVAKHADRGPYASWKCLDHDACPTWKEPPDVGNQGRAHLA